MKHTLHLDELPYTPDSMPLFEALRDLPCPAFLDSSHGSALGGRFDILVAAPADDCPPPLRAGASALDCRRYFDDLARFHRERYAGLHSPDGDLPFCGGLLGYLGYEAGNALHALQAAPVPPGAVPAAALRAYDWCVIQDHLLGRSALVSLPTVPAATRRDLLDRLRNPAPVVQQAEPFRLRSAFEPDLGKQAYAAAFSAIGDYLRAGDCYQVNLARRFSAPCEGDPWQAYTLLREVAGAPFSAYLELEAGALLSLSPERFLSLQGRHVETRPIKGTRPRQLADPAADRALAEALRRSPKDRAENLMIVDLLRNDLGRNCTPGSIRVDRLFEVESFPTVHHLVSTISGELREGRGALDVLRDSFPGGSITGAPKRRAMEIIAELEPHRRETYCGSVLYVSADGRMDSNIAIRTLLCHGQALHCWAGGGIVADSTCDAEYRETIDKVGRFLDCLEAHSGLR